MLLDGVPEANMDGLQMCRTPNFPQRYTKEKRYLQSPAEKWQHFVSPYRLHELYDCVWLNMLNMASIACNGKCIKRAIVWLFLMLITGNCVHPLVHVDTVGQAVLDIRIPVFPNIFPHIPRWWWLHILYTVYCETISAVVSWRAGEVEHLYHLNYP